MGGLVIGNGCLFLAVGIASLIISQLHTTTCGTGSPALWYWVFGTGIAYTIIGACSGIFGIFALFTVVLAVPVLLICLSASGFTFAWMIVGAVSLWRDGGDCITSNFPLWQMGMAGVIISIVMVVCGVGASYNSTRQNN